MYATQNMNLTVWDQFQDYFVHGSLGANWGAIDVHDHSSGKGVQIGTAGIKSGAITSALIADNAITNSKLAPNSVSTADIQDDAVTADQLAPGSVTAASIPDGAISYVKLDPTVLPLGTVMQWWRPGSSSALPGGGWEIMDGRPWSSIPNSLGLHTGNIPDLRGTFVRGADINGNTAANIGGQGGNATVNLGHVHDVDSHTHNNPSHSHEITIDGEHYHTWLDGKFIGSRPNAFAQGISVQNHAGQWVNNVYHTLYIQNFGDAEILTAAVSNMDKTGKHDHGGFTKGSGVFTTDGGQAHSTDLQLGNVSVIPPYISLLYIMRVR